MGNIKIQSSELRKKTIEELEEMKKEFTGFLCNKKLFVGKRDKGLSPREIRKNIARINTIINEKQGGEK